jgi:hypothetical protein
LPGHFLLSLHALIAPPKPVPTMIDSVRYKNNDYSAPTRYGHQEVLAKGYVDRVEIVNGRFALGRLFRETIKRIWQTKSRKTPLAPFAPFSLTVIERSICPLRSE